VSGIDESPISSKQFSIAYYMLYVNKKIPQHMQWRYNALAKTTLGKGDLQGVDKI
jgi:hypothetical protein